MSSVPDKLLTCCLAAESPAPDHRAATGRVFAISDGHLEAGVEGFGLHLGFGRGAPPLYQISLHQTQRSPA